MNLLLGDISLWCKVNGELRQNGETKNMIFSLPYLIAHISQYFTLQVRGVMELQSAKILLLPSKCEIFLVFFKNGNFPNIAIDWFMASFLYCFPYSYRSSNYCDSNSCRSFTLLKALAKSIGNLFAFALKSEKEQQLSLSR